ncbi:response regulator transcription factor [Streptomyces sp. NPDC050121]|uniref:response regulator transcription factor n=1 Tax=Streptomyces sp. NPDC050121 TaxID=3365601 RepID=UPI00379761F2
MGGEVLGGRRGAPGGAQQDHLLGGRSAPARPPGRRPGGRPCSRSDRPAGWSGRSRAGRNGIRTLAAGDALLGSSVTRRLLAESARATPVEPPPDTARRPAPLTERERALLLLLGRGLSNAEIAGRLPIGEAPVQTHVGRVLDRLGLRDRVHAVVFAFDHGRCGRAG